MKRKTKREISESSDSESDSSEAELQEAFAKGLLKPGLNIVENAPRKFVNDEASLKQKLLEFQLKLPWIERLDSTNDPAPLAPEMAAQILEQEEKQKSLRSNNKKLPQIAIENDPVLNDFKREMIFYRQAQAAVLSSIPKLKALKIQTKRPDDYFAEMAKSDEHMQKIRQNLMQKQLGKERSEKIKQLRLQHKEGKALQTQTKLERLKEKKQILDRVKKMRKGAEKNFDFLNQDDSKKKGGKKALDKRKVRNERFGYGGKKRGSKMNTKESSADFGNHRGKGKASRPGKNRRNNVKNRRK
ncbi:hypothetical protein PPYR_12208 [Photinus pyralis]|uniref:Uncharacterized protein n=1 Tax=Photinus pyralis TaxID=7054 RepID=A0A1Y1KJB2_PHOPY|nr:probable rRNA-processing protein EBP2 homolog [Photinus pyralis]KAB0795369.1 hypothetical protein PPYR_12208 [Photinus pyralis]